MNAILAGANRIRIIEAGMDLATMAVWLAIAFVLLGAAGALYWYRRRRRHSSTSAH